MEKQQLAILEYVIITHINQTLVLGSSWKKNIQAGCVFFMSVQPFFLWLLPQ